MNKLTITAGMIVIALCGSQAQAQPTRWFPPQLPASEAGSTPHHERGPKDKITTTCVEGSADYNIDQCYKDIKDK